MECEMCEEGEDKLYLHSKCHMGDPTWAVLDQEKGELEIICAVCEKPICKFEVKERLNENHKG